MPLRLLLSLLIYLSFYSCSGVHPKEGPAATSSETTVLFLVDGFSPQDLRWALAHGAMPNLARFFLSGQPGFRLARASYPSLTYPNISSILTSEEVGAQPVIANKVWMHGKLVNFEGLAGKALLPSLTDRASVFHRLTLAGQESASFSYVFGGNADTHVSAGLQEGLEYTQGEYRDLDQRLLSDFTGFLDARGTPDRWPTFLYIHLVGVDGTSHQYGPSSLTNKAYLRWLDRALAPAFERLARAEAAKKIHVLFTADHGFIDVKKMVPLEDEIRAQAPTLIVTNEYRYLGLYLPKGKSIRTLEPVLESARKNRGVEFTVLRKNDVMEIRAGRKVARFAIGPAVCAEEPYSLALLPAEGDSQGIRPMAAAYRCPSYFADAQSPYPYLAPNLATYLIAPHHPDALVIAAPGISFQSTDKGAHGGPTAEEVYVPLLSRNVDFAANEFVRTKDLLKNLPAQGHP